MSVIAAPAPAAERGEAPAVPEGRAPGAAGPPKNVVIGNLYVAAQDFVDATHKAIRRMSGVARRDPVVKAAPPRGVGPSPPVGQLLKRLGRTSPDVDRLRWLILLPRNYIRTGRSERERLWRASSSLAGGALSLLEVARASGVAVEGDWRSPEWGKLRFDGAVCDFVGGMGRWERFAVTFFAALGRPQDVSRFTAITGSPVVDVINAWMGAYAAAAEPKRRRKKVSRRVMMAFASMLAQDVYELMKGPGPAWTTHSRVRSGQEAPAGPELPA